MLGQHQHEPELLAQPFIPAHHADVLRLGDDRAMEVRVGCGSRASVAAGVCLLEALHERLKVGSALRPTELLQPVQASQLEEFARSKKIVDLLVGEFDYNCSPVHVVPHEVLALKDPHRLADRATRYAE